MSQGQNVSQAQGSAGAASASQPQLPDVNVETYPFEKVQYLLDEIANFNLFALPSAAHRDKRTLTPDNPQDFFGFNGGYGLDIYSNLHRFDANVKVGSIETGLSVRQTVGESIGSLRGRWFFCPNDYKWNTGEMPPAMMFDPWSSQKFVVYNNEFTFGNGNNLSIYGIGKTFPITVNGKPKTLVGAVGNVMQGFGKCSGLEGTFVLTGEITKELEFAGQITCRLVDPYGHVRTDLELSDLTAISYPISESTYVVMRGEKKDKTVRTTFGPPPGGSLVSLITPSQMRVAHFDCTNKSGGIRTNMRIGQVVGTMDATVFFDLLAPPGTASAPVPFTTDEIYKFTDSDGQVVGTLNAGIVEGISFGLKFPKAPGQPGVRFAGFGPITGGTGPFEGVRGVLTVNSLIGIAPHALSLIHVLHIVDEEGQYLIGGKKKTVNGTSYSSYTNSTKKKIPLLEISEDDPFYPLLRHKEDYTETYLKWRNGFRKCSEKLSTFLADLFNRHLNMGDFPGLEIDAKALKENFEQIQKKFDLETFDRYSGKAKGVFKTYEYRTNKELNVNTLYSHWRPETFRVHGRNAKKISGSFVGYFDPHSLPNLHDGKVDIILNSFREDVGLTSWVEIYQHRRQQRTSFAYKLPHPHEILWFVKDVSFDGIPADNNVFMASHEWKGKKDGKTYYYMVAFFFEADFHDCTVRMHGNQFWRALYEEEI